MPVELRHSFEHQLTELQDQILQMGALVAGMVADSVTALQRQDAHLAEDVIERDDRADAMDLEIELRCMRLLASQQPLSRDLRIIGTALKLITDLERIGDYSVDIAKTARRMVDEAYFRPLDELGAMSEATEWMVRRCIQAYVDHDLDLVDQVVARDDVVDECYDSLFTSLLTQMEQNPRIIRQATWLLHAARFLERIADHAVNVVERVYYVETGQLKQLARSHKSEAEPGLSSR